MVTMKDVSKHAGVSIATVSNVITGKRAVSDGVKKRVLRSIKALNYQVNLMARGLKTQKTNTIGVILPDITKLFFQRVLNGILDAASRAGYRIVIVNSDYDFQTERTLVNSLVSSCVDGIILDTCASISDGKTWAGELTDRGKNFPPVISIECCMDSTRISSVSMDNAYYSGLVTQHLIDRGSQRILYISGPLHLEHENARYRGYIDCLERNGLPAVSELQMFGDYLSESGYNLMTEFIEKKVAFDAVQASNDQAAIGALKALTEAGICVPDDVLLCGFDNVFPTTLVSPAITTVSVPGYELGAVAVRELLNLIDNPESQPMNHQLSAELVIRASTDASVPGNWDLADW